MAKTNTETVKFEARDTQNVSGVDLRRSSRAHSHHSIKDVKFREWTTILILIYCNLINYIDRLTVAAVLQEIQDDFDISNDLAGLLQTAFLISYMFVAPLFGYLGDRFNRKYILASGVSLWSLCTFVGSFMETYWSFLSLRILVGVGEASYCTIAPTMISDIFSDNVRSHMLGAFYLAMPVGSGLGYIIGSESSKYYESWHWALRITPIFGLVAVLLILFLLKNPKRGESIGFTDLEITPWKEDIKYLIRNRSFMYATIATTCVSFVVGSLGWWAPKFINMGFKLQPNIASATILYSTLMFGVTTLLAGVSGLIVGCFLSQKLRTRYPTADPIICSIGLIISVPFLVGATYAFTYNATLSFVLLFLGGTSLNTNCAVLNDIILYVVMPTRRAAAEGLHLFITHTFGDAGSPYFVGILSECFIALLNKISKSEWNAFKGLQYAIFLVYIIELLGALFYFICSWYILSDKNYAEGGSETDIQE